MDDPFSCFGDFSESDDEYFYDNDCKKDEDIEQEERGKRLKEAANKRNTYLSTCNQSLSSSASKSTRDFKPIPSSGYEIYSCLKQHGYESGQFGIRAKRKYQTGELILSEAPVLRINTAFFTSTRQEAVDKFENAVQIAFDDLSPLSAQSLMELSSCKENDQTKTPTGIFQTNSYSLADQNTDIVTNTGYGGVFITLARMNHDCNPNVNHFWRPDFHCMNLYATRDIHIGEELCTSYGPSNSSSTNERRIYLQEKYSFKCICKTCVKGDVNCGDVIYDV